MPSAGPEAAHSSNAEALVRPPTTPPPLSQVRNTSRTSERSLGCARPRRHGRTEPGHHATLLQAFSNEIEVAVPRLRRKLGDFGQNQLQVLKQQPGPAVIRRRRVQQQPVGCEQLTSCGGGQLLGAVPSNGCSE